MKLHETNTRSMRSMLHVVYCVGMIFSLASLNTHAIDLSIQPQIRLGTRATDNVRWNAEDQEAAFGFDNGGGLDIKSASQNWNSSVAPSFNFRRFPIGETLDADEYGVRSVHQYRPSEYVSTELRADYTRDSTLTSELTDFGRNNVVANRETITVQPSVAAVISPSVSLNAGFLRSDVSFDSGQESGLVNYTYTQASTGVTKALSERTSLSGTAFVSEFDVADISSTTWTYGVQSGLGVKYSPDFEFNLAVGYVYSDIDFVTSSLAVVGFPFPRIAVIQTPDSVSNSGPIATVNLLKSFENSRAQFDYARRVSPSIRGSQTLEDDISLSVEHSLTRRWKLGFRGAYNMRSVESEEVGIGTFDLNRNQALVGSSLIYQATKEVQLRSEYRFTRQTLTNSNLTVYVHGLFFAFNFTGVPKVWHGL